MARIRDLTFPKRLDDQARTLERTATGPSFETFVTGEREASPPLGGRSVSGWEADLIKYGKSRAG